MNDEISRRIELARTELLRDDNGILIGHFPEGINLPQGAPAAGDYEALLKLTGGPHCGDVVFYRSPHLEDSQNLCDYFPGGQQEWFLVGHVAHQLVALNRRSGAVHIFDLREDPIEQAIFKRLDDFLLVVLGKRYLTLPATAKDNWYELIQRLDLE